MFASAAATGAGIAIAVDQTAGHSELSDTGAALALTIPLAVYMLAVWIIHYRRKPPSLLHRYAVPVASVVVIAASFTPAPVVLSGLALAILVGLGEVASRAAGSVAPPSDSRRDR